MFLILGATGTTGGEVARQLIQAVQKPRLLVRNPSKAHAFEGKAEIVQGDLDRPESLTTAMKGVEKVYLAPIDRLARGTQTEERHGVEHVGELLHQIESGCLVRNGWVSDPLGSGREVSWNGFRATELSALLRSSLFQVEAAFIREPSPDEITVRRIYVNAVRS